VPAARTSRLQHVFSHLCPLLLVDATRYIAMALAVATLWDGNAGFRCAILGWCQSASAFGRELSLARPGGASRFDLLLLLPPECGCIPWYGERRPW